MQKPKAPQLTTQKQRVIAKHKEANPHLTYSELASMFNCTFYQARNAHQKYLTGALNRSKPRIRPAKIEHIRIEFTADELLERQYHIAIASLEAEKNLLLEERVKMLNILFDNRKILQQVKLESHIKRADSAIIASIIRRFEPEASDERIITIYREELEKWKISR